MKIKNKMGHKIDPCVTPYWTVLGLECTLFTHMNFSLFDKYERNQSKEIFIIIYYKNIREIKLNNVGLLICCITTQCFISQHRLLREKFPSVQ